MKIVKLQKSDEGREKSFHWPQKEGGGEGDILLFILLWPKPGSALKGGEVLLRAPKVKGHERRAARCCDLPHCYNRRGTICPQWHEWDSAILPPTTTSPALPLWFYLRTIWLNIFPSSCPPVWVPACLSVCLFVCVFVCQIERQRSHVHVTSALVKEKVNISFLLMSRVTPNGSKMSEIAYKGFL